jgi:hypothetical protein
MLRFPAVLPLSSYHSTSRLLDPPSLLASASHSLTAGRHTGAIISAECIAAKQGAAGVELWICELRTSTTTEAHPVRGA